MPFTVNSDGVRQQIGQAVFDGSWNHAGGFDYAQVNFEWGYGTNTDNLTDQVIITGQNAGTYSQGVVVAKDRAASWRAAGFGTPPDTGTGGSVLTFQTYADVPSFSDGLTPGTPTSTTCPITGHVIPNTVESNGTIYVEYRQVGTVPFTAVLFQQNLSGAAPIALNGTIAALTPGVSYEARFRLDRPTSNVTTIYSNIGTFTTAGSSNIILAPPPMEVTINMQVPALVAHVIDVPVMTVAIGFQIPTVTVALTRTLDRIFVMNDIIKADFRMS